MLKRIVVVCLCMALLFTIFVGCNKEADKSKDSNKDASSDKLSGEIKWFSHRTDFEQTILKDYVEEFKKDNPDVEIKIETQKEYKDTLKLKMSSQDMPDVFGLGGNDYTWDQLNATSKPLNEIAYYDQFDGLGPFTDETGNTFGFPTGLGATAVVYNKKIFTELGIEVPKTLDELIAAGKKITDKGYVGFATAAKAKWTLGNFWGPIAVTVSNDPDITNKMTEVDEPFKLGTPITAGFEIITKFKDAGILEKDPLGTDWEPMKTKFRAGEVGMFFLGNWFIPQAVGDVLKEEDIGFFPFPYDNNVGAKNVFMGPDYAWGMSKDSKNPKVQEAFFNFLCDKKYTDWAQKTGLLSARKDKVVDLGFVKEFESFKPNKIFGIGDSKKLNDLIGETQIDKEIVVQEILTGEKKLDTILAELNKKWKAARGN